MAKNDKIEVHIAVVSDDKGLQEYIKKIAEAKEATQKAGEASGAASEKFGGLGKSISSLATAVGGVYALSKLTSFLSEQAIEAAKEERALNALQWQINQFENTTLNATAKVEEFTQAMEKAGMEDDQVYQSLAQVIPLTRDLEQAQSLVAQSWRLSQVTGRDYNEVLDLMIDLVAGRERSLKRAHEVFGIQASNTQEALDKIKKQFIDGKPVINDHLTDLNRLQNMWKNFKETIGSWVLTAIDFWLPKIKAFWHGFQEFAIKAHLTVAKIMVNLFPKESSSYRMFAEMIRRAEEDLKELNSTQQEATKSITDYNEALRVVKVEKENIKETNEYIIQQISLFEKLRAEMMETIDKILSAEKKKRTSPFIEIAPIKDKAMDELVEMTKEINAVFEKGIDKADQYILASTIQTLKKLEKYYAKNSDAFIDLKKKEARATAMFALQVADGIIGSLNTIMTATGNQSKVLFRLQQALSVAKVIMSTQEAVMKARATYPFPWSVAVVALEIAAGAAAVATIMAQKMPSASAKGGYDIPAGVNPIVQVHEKEMILPADLADKIRNVTNHYGGNQHIIINALTGAFGLRAAKQKLVVGEKKYKSLKVGN